MKKIIYVLIGLVFLAACRDESLDPRPSLEDNVGAVTLVTPNPDKAFFNLLNDLATEEIEFTIDIDGFDVTTVESIDLNLVYTEKDGAVDPFLGIVDSTYTAVSLGTVSTFPSTVNITGAQVAAALNKVAGDFELGDSFVLTFPISTGDGRVLTVALASDLCNQPAQPSAGGCSVEWSVGCPSSLDVETSYEITSWSAGPLGDLATTGTFTWENVGAGLYVWESFTFGTYASLYGCCEQEGAGSAIRVSDVCNDIEMSPDGFGCSWDIQVDAVAGPVLSCTVFGACMGAYTIEFTRTDGTDWPALF